MADKPPPSTAVRLGRVLTSVRRSHNQLQRLLRNSNTLRDAVHVELWRMERQLHAQACDLASRLRQVLNDEQDARRSKRRAA